MDRPNPSHFGRSLRSRGLFRPPWQPLGPDFLDRVAPTWAAGPSKVVILLQRGVKITKSHFSCMFASKVGPSTFKSRSHGPKMTPRAPTGAQMTPKRQPGDAKNRSKTAKSWSRWPPDCQVDPTDLTWHLFCRPDLHFGCPGRLLGATLWTMRLQLGGPDPLKSYPTLLSDSFCYMMIRRRNNKSI